MNKYAEIRKIAILYTACRGILRVKLAAGTTTTTAPPKPTTTAPPTGTGTTPITPTANGTTGGIAPVKRPPKQTWGEWMQDMLDWGSDQMKANGALVTREQQAEADSYNAQQHQEAMQSLANGEYNGWDPSQQVRAASIQTGEATQKENPDSTNSSNGSGGNNITINNNMPEGYGGNYAYGSEGGGGGQQFQQSPSFADYIQQYGQYRNRTA